VVTALALAISFVAALPQFKPRTSSTVGARSDANNPNSYDPNAPAAVNDPANPGAQAQGGRNRTGAVNNAATNKTGPAAGLACAAGKNGGATAPGVTATQIKVASTVVTTGVGSSFLGEAVYGMQAAVNRVNHAGGVCGRRIQLDTQNSEWDGPAGQTIIDNWASSGNYFALVAEPDSEGLDSATSSGVIDKYAIPVVGTDGMLKSQYNNSWIWPVAASTVTNMHIIANYAVKNMGATSPDDFGIVYDTAYKFGREGAEAFNNEVKRALGTTQGIKGSEYKDSCGNGTRYCGISSQKLGGYSSEITAFNNGCNPCKVAMMLLEPKPMEDWMQGEQSGWFKNLFGGEPLFDDRVGGNCSGCGVGQMIVWTGYRPSIQPFDSEAPVYTYCQALHSVYPSGDCHNEFTEGAYLGTLLFIEAVSRVCNPQQCLRLTRDNLRAVLNSGNFDFGLSQPLRFGTSFPRAANTSMAAFQENYSNHFNGWNYLSTGFIADPHPTQDLH
jgi:ABC-type branched-subunit amino acid transport system substrate-binding protein